MKVYKESDCSSPCNEALKELQVIIDVSYQQAYLLYNLPIYPFLDLPT